jgi:hypothetical protein
MTEEKRTMSSAEQDRPTKTLARGDAMKRIVEAMVEGLNRQALEDGKARAVPDKGR